MTKHCLTVGFGRIQERQKCKTANGSLLFQGWFEALRIEGREEGINVCLVYPGPTVSNFTLHAFTGEKGQVRAHKHVVGSLNNVNAIIFSRSGARPKG
jgi:hypothetical protein